MLASPLEPMNDREVSSAFQLCRLFLNQLGFLQWEKRTQFDLLKKTDKLLRDLKHLDHQKCREVINSYYSTVRDFLFGVAFI